MAKSIGVSKVNEPCHIVATPLNTLTPVGTATIIVAYMKNSWPAEGMPTARPLDGVPEEIALVPLIGHTLGHAGVAVRSNGRWLFQAGDAYFFHAEMDPDHPHCTPGYQFYQLMMDKDRRNAAVQPATPA